MCLCSRKTQSQAQNIENHSSERKNKRCIEMQIGFALLVFLSLSLPLVNRVNEIHDIFDKFPRNTTTADDEEAEKHVCNAD